MRTGVYFFALALVNAGLSACSSGGGEFENSEEQSFSVSFTAFLGDPSQNPELVQFKQDSCSKNQTYSNIGSMQSQYQINDLRFYISHPTILLDNNTEVDWALDDSLWQNKDLALIDLEDCSNPATNVQISGKAFVPETGGVKGFCFSLGLPFGFNHNQFATAQPPLNFTSLYLNRRDGYRSLRLDGVSNPNVDGGVNFNVHLASMSCDSDGPDIPPVSECPHPNQPRICIADFDFATQQVALRVDRILVDTDVGQDEATEADPLKKGCMPSQADASCRTVIPRLGLDFVYQPQPDVSTTFPKVDLSLDENKLFQPYTPPMP